MKTTLSRSDHGFTLVEMMIAVAILGILMAIGMPSYQTYIIRSQTGAALKELGGTKSLAEGAIVRHITPSTDPASDGYIGTHDAISSYCNYTIDATSLNETAITCTLKNVDQVLKGVNAALTLERNPSTGFWDCIATNIDANFKPANCL